MTDKYDLKAVRRRMRRLRAPYPVALVKASKELKRRGFRRLVGRGVADQGGEYWPYELNGACVGYTVDEVRGRDCTWNRWYDDPDLREHGFPLVRTRFCTWTRDGRDRIRCHEGVSLDDAIGLAQASPVPAPQVEFTELNGPTEAGSPFAGSIPTIGAATVIDMVGMRGWRIVDSCRSDADPCYRVAVCFTDRDDWGQKERSCNDPVVITNGKEFYHALSNHASVFSRAHAVTLNGVDRETILRAIRLCRLPQVGGADAGNTPDLDSNCDGNEGGPVGDAVKQIRFESPVWETHPQTGNPVVGPVPRYMALVTDIVAISGRCIIEPYRPDSRPYFLVVLFGLSDEGCVVTDGEAFYWNSDGGQIDDEPPSLYPAERQVILAAIDQYCDNM